MEENHPIHWYWHIFRLKKQHRDVYKNQSLSIVYLEYRSLVAYSTAFRWPRNSARIDLNFGWAAENLFPVNFLAHGMASLGFQHWFVKLCTKLNHQPANNQISLDSLRRSTGQICCQVPKTCSSCCCNSEVLVFTQNYHEHENDRENVHELFYLSHTVRLLVLGNFWFISVIYRVLYKQINTNQKSIPVSSLSCCHYVYCYKTSQQPLKHIIPVVQVRGFRARPVADWLQTACPKSIKRMSPPFSKMFSKEISRWQTPWRWRKATACKSCQDHNKMSSFVGWRDEITLKRSPPSAYSSTNQISSLCWKATNISKMYSGTFSPCCRYPKTPISAKGSSESLARRSNNNSRSLAGLCRFTWTRATGSFLAGDFNPSQND